LENALKIDFIKKTFVLLSFKRIIIWFFCNIVTNLYFKVTKLFISRLYVKKIFIGFFCMAFFILFITLEEHFFNWRSKINQGDKLNWKLFHFIS
jgi:hypothetical protein